MKQFHVNTFDEYKKIYKHSIENNDQFWDEKAQTIDWFRKYDKVKSGQLNVSYNCVDRHIKKRGDKVAILWEGNEPNDIRKITYTELYKEVCRVANALKAKGVKKGDSVCIYMPMTPEAAFVMLACARIGAVHSVVFAGFSSIALKNRILDGESKIVICSNYLVRGKKKYNLKETVDVAIKDVDFVKTVIVLQRLKEDTVMKNGRDFWYHKVIADERPYCPCAVMDSEDPLFMLYTSGSTGKPKGILHTTAGYLVYTSVTHKYVFDYQENDIYACVADIGWITGHSYIIYGPLANGATTFMFESTPLYPDHTRYWDMIQRHKITQFYTAPTAIRAVQCYGDEPVKKFDLSSLKVLGTVGEPINVEAWDWYHEVIGRGKTPIVDTYWQTETGGIVITPLPGSHKLKAGSATFPFFGIELALVDADGKEIEGNDVEGILVHKRPWPGIARTVFGDHQRYLNVYMSAYPGKYFTGDGARRDKDGFYFITGRTDDVLNISGHRLGTAEVESALCFHSSIVEAACIGIPDKIKGQAVLGYVVLKEGAKDSGLEFMKSANACVKKEIGSFALPKHLIIVPGLPKTRSGKIMRRILRKIASKDYDKLGDVSTLADPTIVEKLISIRSKLGDL